MLVFALPRASLISANEPRRGGTSKSEKACRSGEKSIFQCDFAYTKAAAVIKIVKKLNQIKLLKKRARGRVAQRELA